MACKLCKLISDVNLYYLGRLVYIHNRDGHIAIILPMKLMLGISFVIICYYMLKYVIKVYNDNLHFGRRWQLNYAN
jgi:hypothetical protein